MSNSQASCNTRTPVCIISGGNSGIGKAAAVGIAKRGYQVAIVSRDEVRGKSAQEEIRHTSDGGIVDLVIGDLGSLDSTCRLANELHKRYDRIDVLINNAGTWHVRRTETPDGLEATFAVNHLAHFLLSRLLLGKIVDSAPARIINVSSGLHRNGRIDFSDLQGTRRYGKISAYSNSKLCNMLFNRELSKRLADTGVTVNALHPGVVRTNLWNTARGTLKALVWLTRPFYRTPEKGAETSVYLATSHEVERVTGKYFIDCKQAQPSQIAQNPDTAKRLWDVSEKLCAETVDMPPLNAYRSG